MTRNHNSCIHFFFELLPFVCFCTLSRFFSGSYLINYGSYCHETFRVARSYEGKVQCTSTITLAVICFELFPFVFFFVFDFCTGHISKSMEAFEWEPWQKSFIIDLLYYGHLYFSYGPWLMDKLFFCIQNL